MTILPENIHVLIVEDDPADPGFQRRHQRQRGEPRAGGQPGDTGVLLWADGQTPIADTIKGKGVSFMENNPKSHGVAPSPEEVELALKELA